MAYGGLNTKMDAAAEIGRNPVSNHQIQPGYGDEQAEAGRDCRTRLETNFSGANGDRGIFIFPVQLTTSRIGNFTRLNHTLLYVTAIHTYTNNNRHGTLKQRQNHIMNLDIH